MIRIFDITQKDLVQLLRDRKIFMFLLIMPIAFTLLFGYAFGGFSKGNTDPRLPVGFLDQDNSWLSKSLHEELLNSEVIRLELGGGFNEKEFENLVAEEKLAAAIVVPDGYGHALLREKPSKIILITDTGLTSGMSVESEVVANVVHLVSAVRTAIVMEEVVGTRIPFEFIFDEAFESWDNPPINVNETTSTAISQEEDGNSQLAHFAPGTMLQFAIAGLLTSAQIIVSERKTRSLQRIFTTTTPRAYVLLGHFITIFIMIFVQFIVLITFGQILLKINYQNSLLATALVAFSSALCIAALGLLIGVMAKSEEQAVIFSLIPMFILSGIGGAWVPLEVVGGTFQIVGHISPVAWAMDGFKSIAIRGMGVDAVLLPAGVLIGYAIIFYILAALRFSKAES